MAQDYFGPPDLPQPEDLPPLEEMIRRIRARGVPRRPELPELDYPAPPKPGPTGWQRAEEIMGLPPSPEEPSLLEKAGEVVGTPFRAASLLPRYIARKTYEAEFPHATERTIPGAHEEWGVPVADTGEMLARATFGEQPKEFGLGRAAYAVTKTVGSTLTDPGTMALFGGIAAEAPAVVHLALIGTMGGDMAVRAYRAVRMAAERGKTPELADEIGGLVADAGMLLGPIAWNRLVRGPRPIPEEQPADARTPPPTTPPEAEAPPSPAPPPAAPPGPPRAPYQPPGFVEPAAPEVPSMELRSLPQAWIRAFENARAQGADADQARRIADATFERAFGAELPGWEPAAPAPGPVEKEMGLRPGETPAPPAPEPAPGPFPPRLTGPEPPESGAPGPPIPTGPGGTTTAMQPPPPAEPPRTDVPPAVAAAPSAAVRSLTVALERARAQGNLELANHLEQRLAAIQEVEAASASLPRPADVPPPGGAGGALPATPTPPPPVAPGGAPAGAPVALAEPPGPAPGVTVRPPTGQPTAAEEAGAASPAEAAAARQAEMQPGVQDLTKRGQAEAAGQPAPPGVPLPPSVVAGRQPTATGVVTTPPIPPAPTTIPPPIAPQPVAPTAGPPVAATPPPTPTTAPGPAPAPQAPQGRITLRKDEQGKWVADHEGPIADRVRQALGTTTVPLEMMGYGPETPAALIEEALRAANPAVEVHVAGRKPRPEPAAPEAPPAAPAFRPAEAPAQAVRGDLGRGPQGLGWLVRTYDRENKPVSESDAYPSKAEAQAALAELQPRLKANRRELRKAEISPEEEAWAAMSPQDYERAVVFPGGVREPNRFDLAELKEQAQAGHTNTAYRAVRAAHTMGRPVHEGWYDVFPMLRKVPKTGERGQATELRPAGQAPGWLQTTSEAVRRRRAGRAAVPAPPPDWHVNGVGEPEVAPGHTRLYNGGGTGWFTTSREVAQTFAEESALEGRDGTIRYLDVTPEEAESYRAAAEASGKAIPEEDAHVVPEAVARSAKALFRIPAAAAAGAPLIYHSGMSRKGDLQAGLSWEQPIGVDVTELTEPAMKEIGRAFGAGFDAHVFVDSGAFGAFKRGETQDLDQVVRHYGRLLDTINAENPTGETINPGQVLLVVPDVIGDQQATLESFQRVGQALAALPPIFRPVFPLQVGRYTLPQMVDAIEDLVPEELAARAVWGVPSNAAAATPADIAALGEHLRGLWTLDRAGRDAVHFLGAGSEKTLAPLVAALGPGLEVSGDSNRLRALIGRRGSREEALRETVGAEEGAPTGRPMPVTVDPELLDAIANSIADAQQQTGEKPPATPDELRAFLDDTMLLPAAAKMDDATAKAYLVELAQHHGVAAGPPTIEPRPPETPAGERKDLISQRPEAQRVAWERLLTRVPEKNRGFVRDQINQALGLAHECREAFLDVLHFSTPNLKTPNRPAKLAAARALEQSLRSRLEAHLNSLAGWMDTEENARLIVKRAWQIFGGKNLERVERLRPPITNYDVVKGYCVGGWDVDAFRSGPLDGIVTLDEAVDFVVQNAPYYEPRVDDADVIRELEQLAGQIDGMGEARLRLYFDIPGVGRTKIKEALEEGPDHKLFPKLLAYRKLARQQDHAFAELVTENQEPVHHVALNGIADNLLEDNAYLQTLPEAERENILLKTFLWGVEDPATGQQATLEAVVHAIREGYGRLFARILTEFEAANGGSQEPVPISEEDIPFAVEGAAADEDIGGEFEAPGGYGKKKPQQTLVPGFLTAVATSPGAAPVQREGKPKIDFTDRPLFTQEEEKAERERAEKEKQAQLGFKFEAPGIPYFVSSPDDPFHGRYGPPPRRATQEQIEARKKWLDLLAGGGKIGGGHGAGAAVSPDTAPHGDEGQGSATVERPHAGGAGGAERAGEDRGPGGGERGLAGSPRGGVPEGRPGGTATAPGSHRVGKGVFSIFDPRAEWTHARPARFDLIPRRLRGLDANEQPLLSEDQLIGVAKAIEGLDEFGAFLFEDGTGVGKTREILATAHTFAAGLAPSSPGKRWKVVIVSKSSAISAYRGPEGWQASGSYANDSKAMEIPITFTKERGVPLEEGRIYLGTYHELENYGVDKDTLLVLDEAHQLKNAGDSEVALQGSIVANQAGKILFATATPGDKPYHMSYLAPIGFLEGKPVEVALKELGCVVKRTKKLNKSKFQRLIQAGAPEDEAREQATETVEVWKTTSPRKTEKSVEGLFERLTAKGTVVKREVDMSPIDVRFATINLSLEQRKAMEVIAKGRFDRKTMLGHMRRQQEPMKLAKVQELTLAELAEGRQVVIYAARVNRSDVVEKFKDPRTGELIRRILMSSEGTLKQLREWLKGAGIPYAEIHGDAEEASADAQRRFQSGKAKVVIATYEKGGTGINLDDTTGASPRSMVMMTAPFGSTDLVQAIGRIHRFTTMTPSRVHMLFSDHEVDAWNAAILAGKIRMLHAMVSGDVQILDPSLLGGSEETLNAGVVHYKDAAQLLYNVMGSNYVSGRPGYNNPISSAKHWKRIVKALRDIGVDITQRGGEFQIPTHEGFVINGSIEKGGAAAVGRPAVYGTAKWEHDEEAGDLVKTIRLEADGPPKTQSGPTLATALAKLRELNYKPAPKEIVSQRQYQFHLDSLTRLGAVFGADGLPSLFRIRTKEGLTINGELLPGVWGPDGRAPRADAGTFWWQQADVEKGASFEAVQTKYTARARSLEDLIAEVEEGGSPWRDLYERHVEIVQSLFGDDADLFQKLLAVTSQASDVRGNTTLALKAYRQLRYGVPFQGFLPDVRAALDRIRAGEREYARGPKMRPYALALTGEDLDAIAVDRHVGRFMLGPAWTGKPKQIELIRETLLEAAKILGWTGRELQAAVWALSQIEQGLSPEEVEHYDQVLIERAAEIRRFRDYFGDVAGSRGWSGPALAALESRAASGVESGDPGFAARVRTTRGGDEPYGGGTATVERPLLDWKRPAGVGRGIPVRPGRTIPGQRVGTVLFSSMREGFSSLGRVNWTGQKVEGIEDAAAIYQTIRNPSLEHLAFFIVGPDGTILHSVQITSHSPSYVAWGDEGYQTVVDNLRYYAQRGVPARVVALHNHPSGNPSPSDADLNMYGQMAKSLGPAWMGGVVINHEQATIVRPDGSYYRVVRSGQGAVDPDPYLAPGMTMAMYYGPGAHPDYRIRNSVELERWANTVLAQQLRGLDDFVLLFTDGDGRLRMAMQIPPELLSLRKQFRRQVTDAGRIAGAQHVALCGPRPAGPEMDEIAKLMMEGVLQDYLIFASGRSLRPSIEAGLGRDLDYSLPWQYLLAVEERERRKLGYEKYQAAMNYGMSFVLSPDHRYTAGSPPPPPAGGAPPPPTPPPPPGPPGPAEEPDEERPLSSWERRVRYARARLRARRLGQPIDGGTFWDSVIVGLDSIRRGFRNFAAWLGDVMGKIPLINRWGRALWDYLRSLGAPVEQEVGVGPRPFPKAAERAEGEVGVPGKLRGPIRPIPSVTNKAIADLVDSFLRGDPVDEGLGKPIRVGRRNDLAINIHQIKDEVGIRDAITRVIRALQPVFDRIRLPKTEAEIRQLAIELGYNLEDYLRMVREKGALTAQEVIAGRVLRQEAGIDFMAKHSEWLGALEGVRRVREKFAAGEATARDVEAAEVAALEAQREQRAALYKFTGIMYGTTAAASEAGRSLRAHAMMVESLTPEERFFRHLFRSNRIDQRQFQALIDALHRNDLAEVGRLVRRIDRPGLIRTIQEYWINSILSGVPTFAANTLGNLTHEGLRTGERGIAARIEQWGIRQGLERLLTGQEKPRERVIGEAVEALRAQARWKLGIIASLKFAWQAVKSEDVRFMSGPKGELYTPALPGLFGKIVRTPGRVLEALDLGAKLNAMAAERAAQVWRRAILEGQHTPYPDVEALHARVRELDQNLGRWIDLEEERRTNPIEFKRVHGDEGYRFLYEHKSLADIYEAMKKAADESTFRDDTTRFTKYIQSMAQTYPFLNFFIPFKRTPERILVQALRRTPVGLAKTLLNIHQGKISGGLASDRLAQGALGTMVSAAVYMLAKDGFITGGGPADPEERRNWLKTGKQPYAIRVGNEWLSLARIEPIATTLGFAADLAEAQDAKIAGDVFDKLHYSVMNNIANKTYLEGLVTAAEALGDPERYGARVWKQMLGGAVPNLLATAARAIDPTIRQQDSVSQTLMARVPILSETLPPRLTGTGEPILRGENALSRFVSPFRYSPEAGPEANLERLFLETGYNPSAPPKSMTIPGGMGRKIQLTSDERRVYGDYAQRATAFARELAANDEFNGLDVYAKEELLKRIYRFAHDAGMRNVWASVMGRMQAGGYQLAARR